MWCFKWTIKSFESTQIFKKHWKFCGLNLGLLLLLRIIIIIITLTLRFKFSKVCLDSRWDNMNLLIFTTFPSLVIAHINDIFPTDAVWLKYQREHCIGKKNMFTYFSTWSSVFPVSAPHSFSIKCMSKPPSLKLKENRKQTLQYRLETVAQTIQKFPYYKCFQY